MKLFNFLVICSAKPDRSSTGIRKDYSGYKVLTANWSKNSLSSDVEKILLSNSVDIWSNQKDIYEAKSVKVMISDELASEFTELLRKKYLVDNYLFILIYVLSNNIYNLYLFQYLLFILYLPSEKGVTFDENIEDVGALIDSQKGLNKSKLVEIPTTFAYDVYYDYDEVSCCLSPCDSYLAA